MVLIEVPSLLRQVHRLSGGDVLQVDDGVGYAALGTDDQALEADAFLALRIADLRVFGDGKIQLMRDRSRPFNGAGDGATVGDRDHSVAALSTGKSCKRGEAHQQKIAS